VSRASRVWNALNVVVVVVALVVQIPITAAAASTTFHTPAARVANLFSFFTILTNIIVAVVCLLLVIDPARRSTLVRTLHLDALVGIIVTGIVYHTVLAGLNDFHGAEWFADLLWHTVSPIVFVVGWLLFGPRGLVTGRVIALSAIYPLAWLVFTLVRGAMINWYPYPFLNVTPLGYGQVTLNCLVVTALFLGLAGVVLAIDRLLGRSSRTPALGAAAEEPVTGSGV
jgi:hypothetical protein